MMLKNKLNINYLNRLSTRGQMSLKNRVDFFEILYAKYMLKSHSFFTFPSLEFAINKKNIYLQMMNRFMTKNFQNSIKYEIGVINRYWVLRNNLVLHNLFNKFSEQISSLKINEHHLLTESTFEKPVSYNNLNRYGHSNNKSSIGSKFLSIISFPNKKYGRVNYDAYLLQNLNKNLKQLFKTNSVGKNIPSLSNFVNYLNRSDGSLLNQISNYKFNPGVSFKSSELLIKNNSFFINQLNTIMGRIKNSGRIFRQWKLARSDKHRFFSLIGRQSRSKHNHSEAASSQKFSPAPSTVFFPNSVQIDLFKPAQKDTHQLENQILDLQNKMTSVETVQKNHQPQHINMNDLTDRMYDELERKIKNERLRLGY